MVIWPAKCVVQASMDCKDRKNKLSHMTCSLGPSRAGGTGREPSVCPKTSFLMLPDATTDHASYIVLLVELKAKAPVELKAKALGQILEPTVEPRECE